MAPDDPTSNIGAEDSQPGNITPGAGATIPTGAVAFTGDLGFGFEIAGAASITAGVRESQLLADVAILDPSPVNESQLYVDAAVEDNAAVNESQLYVDVATIDTEAAFENARVTIGLTWIEITTR